MNKELTSEEKLLRLIKKKPLSQSKETDTATLSLPDDEPTKKREQGSKPPKRGFDVIAILNRLMMLVVIGLVFFLIYEFALNPPADIEIAAVTAQKGNGQSKRALAKRTAAAKPFSQYQRKILEKDIFLPPWEIAPPKKTFNEEVVTTDTLNFSNNLVLMGITIDDQSTAIIQDLKTQKTLFLSVGDEIYNAMLIEIQDKQVVFEINGETVELGMGSAPSVKRTGAMNRRNMPR